MGSDRSDSIIHLNAIVVRPLAQHMSTALIPQVAYFSGLPHILLRRLSATSVSRLASLL